MMPNTNAENYQNIKLLNEAVAAAQASLKAAIKLVEPDIRKIAGRYLDLGDPDNDYDEYIFESEMPQTITGISIQYNHVVIVGSDSFRGEKDWKACHIPVDLVMANDEDREIHLERHERLKNAQIAASQKATAGQREAADRAALASLKALYPDG